MQFDECRSTAHRPRLLEAYNAVSILTVQLHDVGGTRELVQKGFRHSRVMMLTLKIGACGVISQECLDLIDVVVRILLMSLEPDQEG